MLQEHVYSFSDTDAPRSLNLRVQLYEPEAAVDMSSPGLKASHALVAGPSGSGKSWLLWDSTLAAGGRMGGKVMSFKNLLQVTQCIKRQCQNFQHNHAGCFCPHSKVSHLMPTHSLQPTSNTHVPDTQLQLQLHVHSLNIA